MLEYAESDWYEFRIGSDRVESIGWKGFEYLGPLIAA